MTRGTKSLSLSLVLYAQNLFAPACQDTDFLLSLAFFPSLLSSSRVRRLQGPFSQPFVLALSQRFRLEIQTNLVKKPSMRMKTILQSVLKLAAISVRMDCVIGILCHSQNTTI